MQQGFIKAVTKLVRSIERTNHHIQLLNTALEKKNLQEDSYQKSVQRSQIHQEDSLSDGKESNNRQAYSLQKP